jgi:hypothetical protein
VESAHRVKRVLREVADHQQLDSHIEARYRALSMKLPRDDRGELDEALLHAKLSRRAR